MLSRKYIDTMTHTDIVNCLNTLEEIKDLVENLYMLEPTAVIYKRIQNLVADVNIPCTHKDGHGLSEPRLRKLFTDQIPTK